MVWVVGPADAVPYRAIVEASVSPFVILDDNGFVSWAGPAVEVLLGKSADSYIGRHFLDVADPGSHEAGVTAFAAFMRPDRTPADWIGPPILLELLGADGPITCEVSAAAGGTIRGGGAGGQIRRGGGRGVLY